MKAVMAKGTVSRSEVLDGGCRKGFIFFSMLLALFFLAGCGDDESVPVTSISIEGCDQPLEINKGRVLNAVIEPSNATHKTITWKSDNPKVVDVDSNGAVTAIGASEGEAKITATAESGITGSCVVKMKVNVPVHIPVTDVRIGNCNWGRMSLSLNGKTDLSAIVEPANASNTNVYWESDNMAVVEVDDDGTLLAVAMGKARVFLIAEDGGKEASCEVEVLDAMPKPIINSISPTQAGFGATLTISGNNFSEVFVDNSVTVNGIPATIASASKTQLRVTVPKKMPGGKEFSGRVRVQVNGQEAVSNDVFNYVLTPVVDTFAGNGTAGSVNGTGTGARFNGPRGIAINSSGDIYVADTWNNRIRKITPQKVVTTFVSEIWAYGYYERLYNPLGIAIDTALNTLYVTNPNGIYKVTPSRVVSFFAGGFDLRGSHHTAGFADGQGTSAKFHQPVGITFGPGGDLFVADSINNRIRRVTPTSANVTTFAGDGEAAYRDSKDGPPRFNDPYGITADKDGNLYVVDPPNNRVRKISPEGVVSTLAGDSASGHVDGTGTAAKFAHPWGITIDAAGNLYVADSGNHRIRKVTPDGVVTTVAGSTRGFADGIGTAARFAIPTGIAVHPKTGDLYVADRDNHRIRRITFE
jgi:sugar lactone lactonase YvrE